MTTSAHDPRPLDHLVLPTASLDVARDRLSQLGFTVAPVGVHPFGTKNCCVYFADGAFLEPLAIGDGLAANGAALAGNVFIARDKAYRLRHGHEGFSALVFGTSDAKADDAGFRQSGISAGEMMAFSRPFINAEGSQDTASFLLAFAADSAAPDCFFFTCERVNTPKAGRSALEHHVNGVRGIARVVLSASDPASHCEFLQKLTGSEPSGGSDGLNIATPNGAVSVLTPAALRSSFGIGVDENETSRLRAIVFYTPDLTVAERLLARNNVAFERRGDRIIVAPAAGQGAHFIFEGQE